MGTYANIENNYFVVDYMQKKQVQKRLNTLRIVQLFRKEWREVTQYKKNKRIYAYVLKAEWKGEDSRTFLCCQLQRRSHK